MVQRPQTIHRCLLQRNRPTEGVGDCQISCHVCGLDYPRYQAYLNHLFDASCGQRERLTALSVPSGGLLEKKKEEVGVHHLWTQLCPHFDAATGSRPLTLDDFLFDQSSLATLKVELASLMMMLLGQNRLIALGYPDKDILSLLANVLKQAGSGSSSGKEECSSACTRLETVIHPQELKYRRMKARLASARIDTHRFLEICLPDERLWRRRDWRQKSIETILAEILSQAAPSTRPKSPVGLPLLIFID